MFKEILRAFQEKKIALERYGKVKKWYGKGYITDSEWQDFCSVCLDELLEENQKILEKLS